MPELPDVEEFNRRLNEDALGKRIEQVSTRKEKVFEVTPGTLRRHLRGNKLTSTKRHGKWLFARIGQDPDWLALHFGMTGRIVAYDKQDRRPKHTCLDLKMERDPSVAFTSQRKLGHVDLTKDPETFIQEHGYGPDARTISFKRFRERLGDRNATVKAVLMDQGVIAGVGNVYADEALFHARIDPRTRADELEEKDLRRLHSKLQYVLERAIKAGAQPKKMPRTWLVPVRRVRSPDCPRCGKKLEKTKVSGRPTLWCPSETG